MSPDGPAVWTPGRSRASFLDDNFITTGEEIFPRSEAGANAALTTSGTMRLQYFTARKSEAINNMRMDSGSTAAAATPTLVRFGVYSVAANGDLTALVAAIANDTAIFVAGSQGYTRALLATWNKIAGARYAAAVLVVSAAALPTIQGVAYGASQAAIAPRTCGAVTGQADLPASVAVGSVTNSGSGLQAIFTP